MSEYVKLPGSASVYKVDGSSYTPVGTPQAFAELTGQNPNAINWGAVKNVGANYLQGKSQQQTYQAAPAPPPQAPAYAPPAPVQAPTFTPAPSIDLTSIYQGLYDKSGIKDRQSEFDTLNQQVLGRQQALDKAQATINDNPFYSEATRVGRSAKLTDIANADFNRLSNQQKVVQDRIATSKADIETQLNLQTKQFDINSQQAQQAFNQFNSLLQAGALDGASGEDIANITRSTGISSSMINSAVQASQKKNNPVTISQVSDNSGNVTFVALDSNGNVVNKQTVAGAGPAATSSGSGGGTASERKANETQQNTSSLVTDIKSSITLRELIAYYGQVLPLEDIYRLYNIYSPYGKAGESFDRVKQGDFDV